MTYLKDAVKEFAERISSWGFSVYIAERGTYGFITDANETRVLSFSFTDGGSLSGNYGPPSKESGTGWRINTLPQNLNSPLAVHKTLYASAPKFTGKGWTYYTTVKQYLDMYNKSSRYYIFNKGYTK